MEDNLYEFLYMCSIMIFIVNIGILLFYIINISRFPYKESSTLGNIFIIILNQLSLVFIVLIIKDFVNREKYILVTNTFVNDTLMIVIITRAKKLVVNSLKEEINNSTYNLINNNDNHINNLFKSTPILKIRQSPDTDSALELSSERNKKYQKIKKAFKYFIQYYKNNLITIIPVIILNLIYLILILSGEKMRCYLFNFAHNDTHIDICSNYISLSEIITCRKIRIIVSSIQYIILFTGLALNIKMFMRYTDKYYIKAEMLTLCFIWYINSILSQIFDLDFFTNSRSSDQIGNENIKLKYKMSFELVEIITISVMFVFFIIRRKKIKEELIQYDNIMANSIFRKVFFIFLINSNNIEEINCFRCYSELRKFVYHKEYYSIIDYSNEDYNKYCKDYNLEEIINQNGNNNDNNYNNVNTEYLRSSNKSDLNNSNRNSLLSRDIKQIKELSMFENKIIRNYLINSNSQNNSNNNENIKILNQDFRLSNHIRVDLNNINNNDIEEVNLTCDESNCNTSFNDTFNLQQNKEYLIAVNILRRRLVYNKELIDYVYRHIKETYYVGITDSPFLKANTTNASHSKLFDNNNYMMEVDSDDNDSSEDNNGFNYSSYKIGEDKNYISKKESSINSQNSSIIIVEDNNRIEVNNNLIPPDNSISNKESNKRLKSNTDTENTEKTFKSINKSKDSEEDTVSSNISSNNKRLGYKVDNITKKKILHNSSTKIKFRDSKIFKKEDNKIKESFNISRKEIAIRENNKYININNSNKNIIEEGECCTQTTNSKINNNDTNNNTTYVNTEINSNTRGAKEKKSNDTITNTICGGVDITNIYNQVNNNNSIYENRDSTFKKVAKKESNNSNNNNTTSSVRINNKLSYRFVTYKEKVTQLKQCFNHSNNILYNRYLNMLKSKEMKNYFRKLMNIVDFV